MSGAAFLRVAKLKGSGIVAVAARHNKREIQAEAGAVGSIDPIRSPLNYSLSGPPTAEAVAQLARDLMTAADVAELRKDAVRGIEVVFSLPVGTTIDTKAYFTDCLMWATGYFGGMANILSFDVHLDEAAPHAHALILPLVNARMDGSAMVGARAKLLAMQSQFHDQVAKKHGLRKAQSKLTGETKEKAIAQVLTHLRETADSALKSAAWPVIRGCIETEPGAFLLALGLVAEPAQKAVKPFSHYVTSKGKGPAKESEEWHAKPIGFARRENSPNPIGFGQKESASKPIDFSNATAEKEQSLSCVGFTSPPASKTPPTPPKQAAHQRQVSAPQTQSFTEPATINQPDSTKETRSRDDGHEAGQWCEDLGEFISTTLSASKTQPRAARQSSNSTKAFDEVWYSEPQDWPESEVAAWTA